MAFLVMRVSASGLSCCRNSLISNRMLVNMSVLGQTKESRLSCSKHSIVTETVKPKQELHKLIELSDSETRDVRNSKAMNDLIGKMQLNLQKKEKLTATTGIVQSIVNKGKTVPERKTKFAGDFSRPVREDRESDAHIQHCIRSQDITGAVQLLQSLSSRDKYPSRKTLNVLAAICASQGHGEGVSKTADVCEVAYPLEFRWQMNFVHHRAECLWKNGDHIGALKLFERLYQDYPLRRRKITNVSAFCLRDVVSRGMSHLFEHLVACVTAMATVGDLVPVANLWRVSFCEDSHELHCLAEQLVKKHPKLVVLIEGKLPAIVDEAKKRDKPDLFQRLMQLVLTHGMQDSYKMVFGGYLDLLCDQEDVKSIGEAVKYVTQNSINVSATTFQRAIELQNRNHPTKKIIFSVAKKLPIQGPKLQF